LCINKVFLALDEDVVEEVVDDDDVAVAPVAAADAAVKAEENTAKGDERACGSAAFVEEMVIEDNRVLGDSFSVDKVIVGGSLVVAAGATTTTGSVVVDVVAAIEVVVIEDDDVTVCVGVPGVFPLRSGAPSLNA
jgi:hypothetical protein